MVKKLFLPCHIHTLIPSLYLQCLPGATLMGETTSLHLGTNTYHNASVSRTCIYIHLCMRLCEYGNVILKISMVVTSSVSYRTIC